MILKSRYYRGFRLKVNNRIGTVRVSNKEKIIEYNYDFFYRLAEPQRLFLFEWCYRQYKTGDVLVADVLAFRYCQRKYGLTEEAIWSLFSILKVSLGKQQYSQRAINLFQHSTPRMTFKEILVSFIYREKWLRKLLKIQLK